MNAIIKKEQDGIDLSVYQDDPELIPVILMAKAKYEEVILFFPDISKEAFLMAYLAGYERGVLAGVAALKSLNIRDKE